MASMRDFVSGMLSRTLGIALAALLLAVAAGCGAGAQEGALAAIVAANFTDADDALVEEFQA